MFEKVENAALIVCMQWIITAKLNKLLHKLKYYPMTDRKNIFSLVDFFI